MLYLPKLLILPLQLLPVDPVAFDLGHGTFVVKVVHGAVDFGAKVMVLLEEFELAQSVSAKGASSGEGSRLEGLNVLMMISVYHPVD